MINKPLIIGISKLTDNYASWLHRLHDNLELIDFYLTDDEDIPAYFGRISGLLLTGGGDIDPELYGRSGDKALCDGIDERRDRLELRLIALAFAANIPVLGICRGQQMLNVAAKGELYPHIPAFVKEALIHKDSRADVHHTVSVSPGSLLFRLTGTAAELVNSSHHQAVSRLAAGYIASAFSTDGLVEAIEAKETVKSRFCLAVQWHPERMDISNPLSGLLGKGFLAAAGAGAQQVISGQPEH